MRQSVIQLSGLGTEWFIAYTHRNPQLIARGIETIVHDFELRYSRFRSESLIGKLNSRGTLRTPPPELVAMLTYSIELYKQTKGVFDISVGGELETSGYGLTQYTQFRRANNLLESLHISDSIIQVVPGVHLDLGGLGKGWLIDKIADYFEICHIPCYIINGGGDIRCRNQEPLEFYIESPFQAEKYLSSVLLTDGALATSSTAKRTWIKEGKKHYHIVAPVNDTLRYAQTSVRASTALTADSLSTIILMCDTTIRKNLVSRYRAASMLVSQKGRVYVTRQFHLHATS